VSIIKRRATMIPLLSLSSKRRMIGETRSEGFKGNTDWKLASRWQTIRHCACSGSSIALQTDPLASCLVVVSAFNRGAGTEWNSTSRQKAKCVEKRSLLRCYPANIAWTSSITSIRVHQRNARRRELYAEGSELWTKTLIGYSRVPSNFPFI